MNETPILADVRIDNIIDRALTEDLGDGDATTNCLIPPELWGTALMTAKENGIMAGGPVAARCFARVDNELDVQVLIKEGTAVKPGDVALRISGRLGSILKGERVALNLLSRMSGIATMTTRYVKVVSGLKAEIYDTRKTMPGIRILEKYAVRVGGGRNHRYNLGDAVLIKDNHIAALRALGLSLKDIITQARQNAPEGMVVEIEVTNAVEAEDAAGGGADIIMLDNMSPDEMRRVRGLIPENIKTEASGGITLENVRAAAQAGVDIISIGALTHSSQSLDFSLEFEPDTIKLKSG